MKTWAVTSCLVLGWAAAVQAAPLKLEHVSGDARWLAHVDVDGMRSSTAIQGFYNSCVKESPGVGERLDKIRREWGIDLRKDLHDMTFYGANFAPHHGVLIVCANVDKEAMLHKARTAPDHNTVKYRGHEIHTWTDHKGTKHAHEAAGTFYKPDVLVFAASLDPLKSALDVLDGKAPSLAGKKSPLAAKAPEGALFVARAVDIDHAHFPHAPRLLKLVKRLDYEEGEHNGTWSGHLAVTAESAPVAEEISAVFRGVMAMLALHFHDQPGVVDLLKKTNFKVQGNTATATIEAPADSVAAAAPSFCKAVVEHFRGHAEHAKGHAEHAKGHAKHRW